MTKESHKLKAIKAKDLKTFCHPPKSRRQSWATFLLGYACVPHTAHTHTHTHIRFLSHETTTKTHLAWLPPLPSLSVSPDSLDMLLIPNKNKSSRTLRSSFFPAKRTPSLQPVMCKFLMLPRPRNVGYQIVFKLSSPKPRGKVFTATALARRGITPWKNILNDFLLLDFSYAFCFLLFFCVFHVLF